MASPYNFIKAAAAGALALTGGGVSDGDVGVGVGVGVGENTCNDVVGDVNSNGGDGINGIDTCQQLPQCPRQRYLTKYHAPRFCETNQRPSRPEKGSNQRGLIYLKLKESGSGASFVPNQQTVTCPMGTEVKSLENKEIAVKGFDTTWIVENTSTKHVVVAWIINDIEYSPFHPNMKAIDDPMAIIKPGDWISVPTFESFVYHVREIIEDNGGATALGNIVLQHRVGMIPIGKPSDTNKYCDLSEKPPPLDVEPYTPGLELKQIEFGRLDTKDRPCNTIDVGFRNQVGCPLSVYYANTLHMTEVPDEGFSCDEKYIFHMGTQPSSQDFMWDWNSATKYEGSFIGHTFVARLASDPSIIIQKYTLETTKIIDCPTSKKQQVVVAAAVSNDEAEEATITQGTILPSAADDENEERLTMSDSVPPLLATATSTHRISR
jgi:hypothetical protein